MKREYQAACFADQKALDDKNIHIYLLKDHKVAASLSCNEVLQIDKIDKSDEGVKTLLNRSKRPQTWRPHMKLILMVSKQPLAERRKLTRVVLPRLPQEPGSATIAGLLETWVRTKS